MDSRLQALARTLASLGVSSALGITVVVLETPGKASSPSSTILVTSSAVLILRFSNSRPRSWQGTKKCNHNYINWISYTVLWYCSTRHTFYTVFSRTTGRVKFVLPRAMGPFWVATATRTLTCRPNVLCTEQNQVSTESSWSTVYCT